MRGARTSGLTTLELLIGSAIGLGVLGGLTGSTAVGARLLLRTTGRGEIHDIADITTDAFRFDIRRAGFSTTAPVASPITVARVDRLTVRADLDGNGAIDANSEETVTLACLTNPRRVSRIVGAQSLPLANDVGTCALRYFDAQGNELVPPATGLNATGCSRIVAVELAFTLSAPGLPYQAARRALVSRRDLP